MNKAGGAVFCPRCMTFVDSHIENRKEILPVKGVEIEIDAPAMICSKCGEIVFNRELDEASLQIAYTKYRDKMQLLQPAQIKAIREKYGLSQTAFAKVLGLGEKTIARYETGSIQDEAQNNLLLLVEKRENFNTLLWRNKHRLTRKEFMTACSACAPSEFDTSNYVVSDGGEERSEWACAMGFGQASCAS